MVSPYMRSFRLLVLNSAVLLVLVIMFYWSKQVQQPIMPITPLRMSNQMKTPDKRVFFDFPLHSDACDEPLKTSDQPKLIVFVFSGLSQKSKLYRQIIRDTWASVAREHKTRVEFVVGQPHVNLAPFHANATMQEDFTEIEEEHKKYADLLQINIMENIQKREHLVLKWWGSLDYYATHCGHVPHMASVDEDTVLFLDRIMSYLERHRQALSGMVKICGNFFTNNSSRVIRKPDAKYYVSEEQWPLPKFEEYCSGNFQMVTPQSALAVTNMIPRIGIDYVTSFRVRDALTGIIDKLVGVTMMSDVSKVKLPGRFKIDSYPPAPNACDPSYMGQHGLRPIEMMEYTWYMKTQCCNEPNPQTGCHHSAMVTYIGPRRKNQNNFVNL